MIAKFSSEASKDVCMNYLQNLILTAEDPAEIDVAISLIVNLAHEFGATKSVMDTLFYLIDTQNPQMIDSIMKNLILLFKHQDKSHSLAIFDKIIEIFPDWHAKSDKTRSYLLEIFSENVAHISAAKTFAIFCHIARNYRDESTNIKSLVLNFSVLVFEVLTESVFLYLKCINDLN